MTVQGTLRLILSPINNYVIHDLPDIHDIHGPTRP